MAESEVSNGRAASSAHRLAGIWPLRAMLERREERRRFIEAIESLLPELSGLVEDARRTITELQKAATDIARAVERLTERSAAGAEKEPNYGELLCAEILAYWRIGENWSKTTALMMLEALADAGKATSRNGAPQSF